MAKKVHPTSHRLGISERHASIWFARKSEYKEFLHRDIAIRKLVKALGASAGIDKIYISRSPNSIVVDTYTGRPGLIIGKGGSGIAMLEKAIVDKVGEKVKISVHEVKQPYLSSALVAGSIVEGMKRKVPPKVLMRQQLDKIEASGANGVRIEIAGIGPAKQARTERVEMRGGKIPLTTMRSKIDYCSTNVLVDKMYGIKVWIYKGE